MRYALLFPGQASQQVGMGADLRRLSRSADEVFAVADRAAELPLSRVIASGPLERLTRTEFAQPAVVATSLAAFVALRERLAGADLGPPAFCAGHSVGELAALAAAGGLEIEATLSLVARRSQLMAEACQRVDGTMAAVLGLDEAALRELCREASTAGASVELANLNAPGQLVVSGHRQAVARLQELAPSRGARRVIPLNVGGPFHSVYMRPASEAFGPEVERAPLRDPDVPIVLNQTARPTRDAAEIQRELAEQIAAPVRWSDSLLAMAEAGCSLFVEVGPGQVLAGLVRRTLPGARVAGVQDEASLEQAVTALLGNGA